MGFSRSCFSRRGKTDIFASILEAAVNGMVKNRILSKANLNSVQADKFLGYLLERDMLKVTNLRRKKLFRVTKKGLKYIREYHELNSILLEPL